MHKELIDKIEKARFQIFINHPYLGFALQHFEILIKENIKTAATNGKEIYFDPIFLDKLTMDETIFVLLHELLHILLMHVTRRDDRSPYKYNIACDIVVNDILCHYDFDSGTLPIIKGSQFQMVGHFMTVEQAYNKLPVIENVVPFDMHSFWELSEEEKAAVKNIISKITNQAIEKGYDKDSGALSKRMIKSNDIKHKKTNWKKALESIISKDVHDYSFERRDHRYHDVLMPQFTQLDESLYDAWFVVDVSGSMRSQEIGEMFEQIMRILKIFKSVRCYISFFSTTVSEPKLFKNKNQFMESLEKIYTRGGTNFHVIFNEAKAHFKTNTLKAIIVMTDGFADYPKSNPLPQTKVIWTINNDRVTPPFGHVIRLI